MVVQLVWMPFLASSFDWVGLCDGSRSFGFFLVFWFWFGFVGKVDLVGFVVLCWFD
jgi:hypothetical protein